MPGLLEQPAESAPRARWYAALAAEYFGVLLFGLLGTLATGWAGPVANGLLIAVLLYICANVSGGHLNPAVTFASAVTGHTSISRGLAYVVAQVAGGTSAALLLRIMVPHGGTKALAHIGCFSPQSGATLGQAFGWELVGTALLILTVYAVAVGEPSFGNAAPLAIGLSVIAAAATMGKFSGGAINPARVIGPAIASGDGCGSWGTVAAYSGAELLGGLVAALMSAPLYGLGIELGSWGDAVSDKVHEAYERVEGAVGGAVGTVRERLVGGGNGAAV
jgi:glycerol uptake facilitator-like aquaporin